MRAEACKSLGVTRMLNVYTESSFGCLSRRLKAIGMKICGRDRLFIAP